MEQPFWARVVTPKWVGRFEVNAHGTITFTPPIAGKWKGKQWKELKEMLELYGTLVEYQIYYE